MVTYIQGLVVDTKSFVELLKNENYLLGVIYIQEEIN